MRTFARDTFAAILRGLLLTVVASCAHVSPIDQPATVELSAPGSGGPAGVSLARDWTIPLVEAQPIPFSSVNYLRNLFDARYLKLTGGTLTGAVLETVSYGLGTITPSGVPSGTGTALLASRATDNGALWLGVASPSVTNYAMSSSAAGDTTINELAGTSFSHSNSVYATLTQALFSHTGAIQAAGSVRSVGVATGSLPTCNAGMAGAVEYDTTRTEMVRCNGTTWVPLTSSTQLAQVASGYENLGTAATITVVNATFPQPVTVDSVFITQIDTAGSGAGTFTIRVRDNTTPATLCTTGTIACNTGVGGTQACTGSTTTTGRQLSLDVQCTGCTTCPKGNFGFVYHPNT